MESPANSWSSFILVSFIAFLICVIFGLLCVLGGVIALSLAPATYSMPIAVTDNPVGSKTGTAEDCTYFFIFGDASDANILQACRNSGITKISTVDYQMHNHMFIWQTYTCVVSGE